MGNEAIHLAGVWFNNGGDKTTMLLVSHIKIKIGVELASSQAMD